MGKNPSSLALARPCDTAVDWVTEQLGQAGFSVMRTFDLQVARHAQVSCTCPHHGTELCDCQVVVLLVYAGNAEPITLIAHGHNDQTEFSVVDTPQQHADPQMEAIIRGCFSLPAEAYLSIPSNAAKGE